MCLSDSWIEPSKVTVGGLVTYRNKYMADKDAYMSNARENYRLHYKAAVKSSARYPCSVARMEYVVNEAIKQRMLKS